MDYTSLCVQIWGNPFDMVSPQVAAEVGSRLGVMEEVERRRRQDDLNFLMKVHVALPITKPLRRGGFIAGSDGVHTWVTFKYERLLMFFHYCGMLGHDLRHCATHFTVEKNGGKMEHQYGDWFKAVRGRQRTPSRHGVEKTLVRLMLRMVF